jgi:hypothetical protein
VYRVEILHYAGFGSGSDVYLVEITDLLGHRQRFDTTQQTAQHVRTLESWQSDTHHLAMHACSSRADRRQPGSSKMK